MQYKINNQDLYDESVQADKLQLLYRQSFPATFFSLIAAFLYVSIVWSQVNKEYLSIWLGATIVASLLRVFLFLSYRKKNPQGNNVIEWEKPYFITLMLSSFIWGIGTVILSYKIPFLYQVITYFLLIGMAGSALTVYSAIRYISVLTVTIILLPMTLWFLFLGSNTAIMMGIAGVVFMGAAFRATRVLADSLHYSYMLTHALSRANEEAEKLASTDMLTGINNRRAFTTLSDIQVDYCKRHENPVTAIILDVDHFKKINDKYGHAAGDAALKHLSEILQNLTRSSDVIGRIGGEEFAILLTNTAMDEAKVVAEKLRNWIADHPVHLTEDYFSMTVSIGVASNDSYNLEQLLNIADKAMYKAKEAGRNQVMCSEQD